MRHPRRSGTPILMMLLVFLATAHTVSAQDGSASPARQREGLDFPSINAVLWQNAIERIRSSEELGINRFFTSEEEAQLAPASALSTELVRRAQRIDYTVGVESLHLIPRSQLDPHLASLPRDEFLLSLYNTLRSVSSLEGIEYYSASRDRMRTLFAETWIIRGPDDETRLPDPTVSSIPESDTIYIHQKDLTFGENISEVLYTHRGNALSMSISNETTMRYMLFPLVRKGNMSMQMLILPVEEGILFYGLSSVDVLDLKVFYDKMRASFTNRLIALKDWFIGEVGR